jgi:tetraacyldisaccharide 4'-kinase
MSAFWESVWYPEPDRPSTSAFLRAPLRALSAAYGVGTAVRNAAYDRGWLKSVTIPSARVISVGNLVVGGSGKTPAVIHMAKLLSSAGKRVAVLSRGYKRASSDDRIIRPGDPSANAEEVGDEPALIARSCPEVLLGVGTHRAALALRLAPFVDVILIDDGMQHRRVGRAEEIVVVDGRVGLGNRMLLPRGPLRESERGLRRASLLWIREEPGQPARFEPPQPLPAVRVSHVPTALIFGEDGRREEPAWLSGRKVLAFAALGRPGSFVNSLKRLGARVERAQLFEDHHPFKAQELSSLVAQAASMGAALVTTEKDEMRLPPQFAAWVLRQEVKVNSGEEALRRALQI